MIFDEVKDKIEDATQQVLKWILYPIFAVIGFATNLFPGMPGTEQLKQDLNEDYLNTLLEPNLLADAVNRGIVPDVASVRSELQKAGYSDKNIDILIRAVKQRLDLDKLIMLRQRGKISASDYNKRCKRNCLTNKQAKIAYKLSEQRIEPDIVLDAKRRGIPEGWSDKDYDREIRQQGFSKKQRELLKEQAKFYPSPQDLVSWQAKEVYEPEMIKKLGLDDEFDNLDLEPFKKGGVNEEQAKNYWMAHWEHPSWFRVQEMLHRTDLSEEDVWEWFKLVEIPPYWREKLTEVMYKPYTRVDVRRMHDMGILDDEGVKRAYLDLGYNEEKAQHMVEFTREYNKEKPEPEMTKEEKRAEKLKGLTRSNIQKQYEMKMITRDEASDLLVSIGLSKEVTEFYLSQSDYDLELDRVQAYLDSYHRMYLNGIRSYDETSKSLDELNIPGVSKEYFMDRWTVEKDSRTSQPSKADLRKFVKQGIISVDEWEKQMAALQYSDRYITWYKQLYKIKSKK